jgi:murein DD-endopeptidase MepM/ murein hydrolase activator NlpD
MSRARVAHLAVLVAVVLTVQVVGQGIGRADTASDLEAARQKLVETQAAANATAAEISAAEGRFEELGTRIDALEAQVERTRKRKGELVEVVRARALHAYTGAADSHLSLILEASGPLEAARRTRLLDLANRKDNLAAKKLAALQSDLHSQQSQLRTQREEEQKVRDELEAKNAAIQARLVSTAKARDDLITRLEAERAAAAAAAAREAAAAAAREAAAREAAAAAELSRLRAAQQGSTGSAPTGGGAGQIIANPGGGSFQCPVNGAAYTDNYGPRGSGFHYGIDMFAPTGTPIVAVKPGTVRYVPNEGAGGNTVYLSANDGNVYFYAHLSSFVGGARSVAQGEIVGLVGATGNASGPHLHFEIRLGGVNGARIDPYPTLRAAGC